MITEGSVVGKGLALYKSLQEIHDHIQGMKYEPAPAREGGILERYETVGRLAMLEYKANVYHYIDAAIKDASLAGIEINLQTSPEAQS